MLWGKVITKTIDLIRIVIIIVIGDSDVGYYCDGDEIDEIDVDKEIIIYIICD